MCSYSQAAQGSILPVLELDVNSNPQSGPCVPVCALSTLGHRFSLTLSLQFLPRSTPDSLPSSGLPRDILLFPGDLPGPPGPTTPVFLTIALPCCCLGRVTVPSPHSSRMFSEPSGEQELSQTCHYSVHSTGAFEVPCSLGAVTPPLSPAHPPGAPLGTRTTGGRGFE